MRLLENPEKCAAVDRVFTDIGVPPVSDWVTRWEMQKASQIQESKRIADMATASNDPKNLVKPVLKLSDPKLVLAPGRFPPISNPNLSGPSSANISQPTANDQSNPPFNNQGQSSGGARPPGMPNSTVVEGGMVGTTVLTLITMVLVDEPQLKILKRMRYRFCLL